MSEIASKRRPLYASLPTVYDHHDQLWAGTPAHFLEHLSNDFDYRADNVWLSSQERTISHMMSRGRILDYVSRCREGIRSHMVKFLPSVVSMARSHNLSQRQGL